MKRVVELFSTLSFTGPYIEQTITLVLAVPDEETIVIALPVGAR